MGPIEKTKEPLNQKEETPVFSRDLNIKGKENKKPEKNKKENTTKKQISELEIEMRKILKNIENVEEIGDTLGYKKTESQLLNLQARLYVVEKLLEELGKITPTTEGEIGEVIISSENITEEENPEKETPPTNLIPEVQEGEIKNKKEIEEIINNIDNVFEGSENQIESTTEEITNPEVEIVTKGQPEHIIVEKIIENSLSAEEKEELQKEFPNENIEKKMEKIVVEEMNIKKGEPEKESLSILGKIRNKFGKRIRKTFLLLMAVGTFQAVTSFSSPRSADATSYDKLKIENLKDWEGIKLDQEQINKLDNISIINKANEGLDEKYLVVDKQNGKTLLYQGDNFIKSYNVCLGDSIGDEQTKLKSTYKKNLYPIGRDEDGEITYKTRNASIQEATYIKNGERYLKNGYDAWTDWGEGNMKTGAGIYEVSNKGPFLKDVGLFLKNERGEQVATSLHYNSHFIENEDSDPRFTNGCVGYTKEDIHEIYASVPIGSKVYILPDNPLNKFKIIDGELRFVSNEKNVNKTIRPYDPKPIILKAENVNDDGREVLTILANYKKDLMKLYPTVSNDLYNELAKIAYGIFGQESTFGTYGGLRGQAGRIADIGKTIFDRNPTVGKTQVKITSVNKKIKEVFDIKKTSDLFNIKKGTIATMSVLLDAYINSIPNGKKSDYKKLLPLFYNSPEDNFKKALHGGKANYDYSNKVLKNSNLVKVYMGRNNI